MDYSIENVERITSGRKRIWQIANELYCPIIGSCFTHKEIKKIIIKSGYDVKDSMTDYDLHSIAVSSCSSENRLSSIVEKTLNAQFKRYIERYSEIDNGEDLYDQWKEDLSAGDMAPSLWAMAVHPLTEGDISIMVFGDIHMLSHSTMLESSRLLRELTKVKQQLSEKNDTIQQLRAAVKENRPDTEAYTQGFVDSLKEKNAQQEEELQQFRTRATYTRLMGELSHMTDRMNDEKSRRQEYESELFYIKNELQAKSADMELYYQENRDLKEEISVMEEELDFLSRDTSGCDECSHMDCQCRLLKDKTIVYVGGRSSAIPYCKRIVEEKGGLFLHHDGGLEEASGQLHGVIHKADIVFFPVDSISHEASSKIKKYCINRGVPLHYLRSSGVSSFARELVKVS